MPGMVWWLTSPLSPTYHMTRWRCLLAILLATAIFISRTHDWSAPSQPCDAYAAHWSTRHARRHRRHQILPQVDKLSKRLHELQSRVGGGGSQIGPKLRAEVEATTGPAQVLLAEARCLAHPSEMPSVYTVRRRVPTSPTSAP